MKLNADISGSVCLKKTDRFEAVVGYFAVRAVVTNSNVILLSKSHGLLEEGKIGDCGGWIVGVVEPEKPGAICYVFRYCREVRQKPIFLAQRQVVGFAAGKLSTP